MNPSRIRRLLDRSGLEYVQIAHDAGLSIDSLYAWRTGRRSPLPDNLRQLAAGLEHRAAVLTSIANRIRKEIDPMSDLSAPTCPNPCAG